MGLTSIFAAALLAATPAASQPTSRLAQAFEAIDRMAAKSTNPGMAIAVTDRNHTPHSPHLWIWQPKVQNAHYARNPLRNRFGHEIFYGYRANAVV